MKNWILALAVLALGATLTGCDDSDDPSGPTGSARVRVAHLSPDAPNVDVWVDGGKVLTNVPFKAVSAYLTLESGSHRVQVVPTGALNPVVIDATLELASGLSYTVAATGLLSANDIQPLVLTDDSSPGSQVGVRFVHACPDAPPVDIAVTGGPILFRNVPFRGAQGYADVGGGTYDLEARVAGTTTVALAVPDVALTNGTNVTIFAIGRLGNGTLQALPVADAP